MKNWPFYLSLICLALAMAAVILAAGCSPPQDREDDFLSPVSASPPIFYSVSKETQRAPISANQRQIETNSANRVQFVSADREALYRSFFPRTDDSRTNLLKNQVSFYDEEAVPRVYQVWDLGINSGLKRVDGGQVTANNEFPWAGPAGTLSNDNHKTIRFVKLDRPIEWFRKFTQRGEFDGYGWHLPIGTIFGEILLVADQEGRDHAAELRTRRKNSDGDWTVNAFRPFPKEKGFLDGLHERGFDFRPAGPVAERINSGQQNRPFIASANFERLPAMPSSLVASLLDDSTFRAARHKSWSEVADGPTAEGFSIVPTNFIGGFIPVNNESCARCHEDAGRVVNLKGDTRWRLRGDDRIFSFNIFAPGKTRAAEIQLNQTLVEAGLLVHKPGAP